MTKDPKLILKRIKLLQDRLKYCKDEANAYYIQAEIIRNDPTTEKEEGEESNFPGLDSETSMPDLPVRRGSA